MKKITLLLMFMSTFWTYAQISSYSFSQTQGSYASMSGGTALVDSPGTAGLRFVDPAVLGGSSSVKKGPGFPIGFNFTFNGLVYDSFGVSSYGWISLGQSALQIATTTAVDMTSDSTQSPLDTKGASDGIMPDNLVARIAALSGGLVAQTNSTLSFKTDVIAGSRVLIVQWENYKAATLGDSFNFQIRLYETTNVVQIVYGTITTTLTTAKTYQVGLRAGPQAVASNFSDRISTTGWGATAQGLSTSATVSMTNLLTPASGLTFSWTPPTCGGATGLAVSAIGNNTATLTWNSNLPAPASGYEYVVSTSSAFPTATGTPTANTTATVALNPNTVYYVFLRSNCGTEYTAWTYGGTFKTKCNDVPTILENFDSYNAGGTWPALAILPACWESAGTAEVNVSTQNPASGTKTLYMRATAVGTSYAILPPVSNLGTPGYRLKFKATANVDGRILDIGYFTNPSDVTTFTSLDQKKTINAVITGGLGLPAEYIVTPPALSGVKSLVFKVAPPTSGTTSIYIDDVIWEPIPPCNDITGLVQGYALDNSITFNWTKSASNETAWQYVYGPALTTTDPNSPSLTPVDVSAATATTASVLSPSTAYKVWVRSKCSATALGLWIGPITMTTTCAPTPAISENFEAATLSTCWQTAGTAGDVALSTTNPAGGTGKSLMIRATSTTPSYALLPLVNNIDGNHRLRFKATANLAGAGLALEVGYFTNPSDLSTFTLLPLGSKIINMPNALGAAVEYYVTPPAAQSGVRLVLRNAPATTSTVAFYIDDLFWESIPTCLEVTGLLKGNFTSNSITFNWTKSGSNETAWQYVYGPDTTTDPNSASLTPVDVSVNPTATVIGLQANNKYKVWVRAKCSGTSFGLWIGPISMTTSCTESTQFVENFDASTSFPSCWTRMTGTSSNIGGSTTAPSGPNVLKLYSTGATDIATVSLPPLTNAGAGTHRLRLRAKADTANAKLDIGYMTNMSDPNSYNYLQTVTITSTTVFDLYSIGLGSFAQPANIVLRNPGTPFTTIYIDEVVWEPIPVCADIKDLASKAVTNTTATIAWTPGASQNAWQYVLSSNATVKDPSTLTPILDVLSNPTVTIPGLSASTAYKVWVRSRCTDGSFGAWFGPVVFSTSCASDTAFSQNFDTNTSLPSCWTKVGGTGTATVNNSAPYSLPNSLNLTANTSVGTVVIAMPPVSNAGAGTHRLRFKVKASLANNVLEVGYLQNFADPASFAPLQLPYTATQNTSFVNQTYELGMEPATDYLAFRVKATAAGPTFYIDDVIWEPIPPCTDVSNVVVNSVNSTTATIQWTKGASQTAWQYVKGATTVIDPNTLAATAVNVLANPVTTIGNLTNSTSYKVWVRSSCGGGYGIWSDPITFKTTCAPATEYTENFDANTSLPACWTVLADSNSSATVASPTSPMVAPSAPNHLVINSKFLTTSWIVVGLRPVSNAGASTHRLKFKCLGVADGSKFELGYLVNPNDASTFQLITTLTATLAYETIRINDISGLPGANEVLAFRIPLGSTTRTIYIDDLVWEPLPSCADVSQVKVSSATNTATVEWFTYGTGTQWQVSVTPDAATGPDVATALTANTTKSLNWPGLSPATYYKAWVRSVCGTEYGQWSPALKFETKCVPAATLNENWDGAIYPNLPVCWGRIIQTNATEGVGVYVTSSGATSLPNGVNLGAGNSGLTDNIILVSPPVTTLSLGTHRLRFNGTGGINVEVGTLSNPTDSGIFTKVEEIPLTGTSKVLTSGSFPVSADQYIGIRLKTTGGSNQYAVLDNLVWEVNPNTLLANDQFDVAQFSYYPNPVKDVLNISYINNISGVTVYNLLGQEVATKTVNENFAKVDMSSLTTGTYMVKVTSDNQIKTIKVIKE